MFLDLEVYDSRRKTANSRIYYFKLTDSHFIHRFTAGSPHCTDVNVVVEIIKTYRNRNRHVVKELAKYYEYARNNLGYEIRHAISSHYEYVDTILPNGKYKTEYYPLLKNVYLKKYLSNVR